jgi:ketosteroid isomerase-like protein
MSRENVDLLRNVYSQWERGDFDTSAFDPDVDFARIGSGVVAGAGGPGRWRGHDEMRQAVLEWLSNWEEFHVEAETFIDLGNRVLVLELQTARGKDSGVPVRQELGDLFTLRDGKIVSWEAYWHRDEALRAAGLSE